MTIQDAIKHAVTGGYHLDSADGVAIAFIGANDEYSAWTRTDTESSFMISVQETLLDPRFWHALGRTLGWEAGCDLTITCAHGAEECRRGHGTYWMYQWHCFIQALAEGHTPAAFFAQLPATPTRSGGTTHRHQAGQARPRRACLFRLTAQTRQRAQHICAAAARAQAVAKARVRRARRAGQQRRSA
jgi:hypothetical protein